MSPISNAEKFKQHKLTIMPSVDIKWRTESTAEA